MQLIKPKKPLTTNSTKKIVSQPPLAGIQSSKIYQAETWQHHPRKRLEYINYKYQIWSYTFISIGMAILPLQKLFKFVANTEY